VFIFAALIMSSDHFTVNRRGADGIREYIDGGIAPPNAPVTLSGGWIYNRVAKKGVLVSGKAGDKPMFDTGALYNDFDYEITGR